jgi:imidazolonepropionase-like amidohydrolase
MVLIEDGRITAVDGGGVDPPDGIDVVDLGDVTLIPGLIDTHVHLGLDAGCCPVEQMNSDEDAALILRMRLASQRALASGVTTLRDLGDRGFLTGALRAWFRTGAEVGPEIIVAGPPLTVTGGHCHFMGGETDGELEVRRAVRTRVKRGVDVIKVMATGGMLTPGTNPLLPAYSRAELGAAVEEAHRLGRKVTAHAQGVAGIAAAVEAGVDGIEHCFFWVGAPDLSLGRPPCLRAAPELIDEIARRQIEVCPTLGHPPGATLPAPIRHFIEAFLPVVERMHHAGVCLVAGTDAGVSAMKPHDGLACGVRALASAGLSNVEALRSATSRAAVACDVADRKGTLVAGKDADIVAVVGDPLADVQALQQVEAVYRAGVRVGVPTAVRERSESTRAR